MNKKKKEKMIEKMMDFLRKIQHHGRRSREIYIRPEAHTQ